MLKKKIKLKIHTEECMGEMRPGIRFKTLKGDRGGSEMNQNWQNDV